MALIAMTLLLHMGARAGAQESRSLSVNTFQPAPGSGSFLSVEGAAVDERFELVVGALFNYQYKPLEARICRAVGDGGGCTDWGDGDVPIIKHRLVADVTAAVSMFRIVEAGVALPIVVYQEGRPIRDQRTGDGIDSPDVIGGLEDLRLHLKLDIFGGIFGWDGGPAKLDLAIIPVVSFPVGDAVSSGAFMGDSFITFHPKLALTSEVGRVRIGANVGYLLLEEKQTYAATIGGRISYGADRKSVV
jgi:hypothetical protein